MSLHDKDAINPSPAKEKWGLNNSFSIWWKLETWRLSKSKTKTGKYGFSEDKDELLNGTKANKLPFHMNQLTKTIKILDD